MNARRPLLIAACVALFAATAPPASAQRPLDLATVADSLARHGRMTLARGTVTVSTFDFVFEGDSVEAIAFRPMADGPHPGLLLVPGFGRTARDFLPTGLRFAREGFACVAVSQRGFGRSSGRADFVGPKTVAALEAALARFRREPYVDSTRIGLFGYSRGAMAVSLLAVRPAQRNVKAAVFAAGVYDFRRALADVRIAGIRENMLKEAGTSDAAADARTSASKLADLHCPVLVLHGERDVNAPVSQALLLRDSLAAHGKRFELTTFPDREHDIGAQNLYDHALPFLKRELSPASPAGSPDL